MSSVSLPCDIVLSSFVQLGCASRYFVGMVVSWPPANATCSQTSAMLQQLIFSFGGVKVTRYNTGSQRTSAQTVPDQMQVASEGTASRMPFVGGHPTGFCSVQDCDLT